MRASQITRRSFIRATALAVAGLGWLPLDRFASRADAQSSPPYQALVCVFLLGGNDANNMVVPTDSRYTAYARARQGLAIPPTQVLALGGSTPGYGLHPSMPELQALYDRGLAAIVANVGTLNAPITVEEYLAGAGVPLSLYSHDDQQNQWQSSVSDGGPLSASGWGGRIADLSAGSSGLTALSLGGNLLFVNGQTTRSVSVNPGQIDYSPGGPSEPFEGLLTQASQYVLVNGANSITANALQALRSLSSATSLGKLATVFPADSYGLGQSLKFVAEVISSRQALGVARQVFIVPLASFDTHVSQLATQAALLSALSQGIAAFYQATVELGLESAVTTFTMSEFNRTFQPNTTAGTDHAWGTHQLVIGGSVVGGLYGDFPILELGGPTDVDPDARGLWLPQFSVDQYGATLARWLGLQQTQLNQIFPHLANFAQQDIGFMATS
ncbi:MAG TPA: DUF1501 domain-containing protein [Candidatus Binataceae bacterium]|nr:DUF1501 domain-containing protein [Candidatus Binataceae bacterium]